MKQIPTSALVVGDIFTNEMKLNGRKAYLVTKVNQMSINCIDRADPMKKVVSMKIEGNVWWLRHVDV